MQQRQFPQRFITRSRLAILPFFLCSLFAQRHYEAPLDGGWPASNTTQRQAAPKAPAGTVSVELLRYPLSGKARNMLQTALHFIDLGDHKAAVSQLEHTLTKYPSSAPYTQSLLGVEYLKTDRYADAVDSLQQAVDLLPHDAINHANLGLSLVSMGQLDRAKQELHRALELDPHIPTASQFLAALPPAK
jgi:tetratricopeptide (TPR) repeat protein